MAAGQFATTVLALENQPPQILLKSIIDGFKRYSPASTTPIERAFEIAERVHAGQTRESGVPYLTHPLICAWILLMYQPDRDTLVAAILHDTFEDSQDKSLRDEVEKAFGKNIVQLIEGVSKINTHHLRGPALTKDEETIRKMFRYAEKDVRIILIKLADRLHNIVTLGTKKDPEKRRPKAQETIDIFVPVAARLGLWELKTYLEDISFGYLHPDDSALATHLDSIKPRATAIFDSINTSIRKNFSPEEISSVTRIDYSPAWLHDRKKLAPGPEETFYVKLVVPSEEGCYRALTKLSHIYTGKTQELEDYITSPKDNGYQALHATMIVDGTYDVRFHILTEEMDIRNTTGVTIDMANTMHLKEFFRDLDTIDRATLTESSRYIQAIQGDMLDEKILIHYQGGEKTYLPRSATVLDAVFFIFPEKALFTESVMVNNKPAALSQELQNNDVIKPVFSDAVTATIHWMPYLHTTHARTKLQTFLKGEERNTKIALGQSLLQTEYDRYARGEVYANLSQNTQLLNRFHVETVEELFILVAEGLVLPAEVLTHALEKGKGLFRRPMFERFASILFPSLLSPDTMLRLKIRGHEEQDESIQKTLKMLCQKHNVVPEHMSIKQRGHDYEARLTVRSSDRSALDVFFLALRDQAHVAQVRPLIPTPLFAQLVAVITFACTMGIIYLFALGRIIAYGENSLLNYLSVLPVLLGNFFGYQFVSYYFPRIRSSRWFVFLIFGINALVVSLLGAALLTYHLDILNFSLFFPLTLLVLSSLSIMYIFLQRHTVQPAKTVLHSVSAASVAERRKNKILGYSARLMAVVIWGLEPLYIKYTLVNTIDPSDRIFLKAIGGLVPSIMIGLFLFPLLQKRKASWSLPKNSLFVTIIVGEILFTYLINSSLLYTSSTNVILLNNFAPVISLIIAAILWRSSIPYLRKNRYVAAIFLAFVVGSIGSTLLFYNDIKHATQGQLYGDFLGTLTMLTDVFLVIAMIRYVQKLPTNKSVELNFNIFLFSLLFTAPIAFLGASPVWNLSVPQLLFGVGAGILSGCGRILNFEAFRRIDGFLAFLMFNISILLTFVLETFLLERIVPTLILVIGGLLIMGSSVVAEYINTKSERELS